MGYKLTESIRQLTPLQVLALAKLQPFINREMKLRGKQPPRPPPAPRVRQRRR